MGSCEARGEINRDVIVKFENANHVWVVDIDWAANKIKYQAVGIDNKILDTYEQPIPQ